LPPARGEPCAGHALAQAAFLEEILLEPADLLVEEIVGLVDEADQDVGDQVRDGFRHRSLRLIGRIGFRSEAPHEESFLGILVPQGVAARVKKSR
jgi:hypothetical protein